MGSIVSHLRYRVGQLGSRTRKTSPKGGSKKKKQRVLCIVLTRLQHPDRAVRPMTAHGRMEKEEGNDELCECAYVRVV